MLNNRRRRPTHPGAILREDILPSAGITQIRVADALGVSRRAVSEIIHEQRRVGADMAHRLARYFKTTPEFWLNLQQAVDLWETLQSNRAEYQHIPPLSSSRSINARAP